MKYESFSLRIEPAAVGLYAVSVQSPQGEGQGTFEIPRQSEIPGPGATLPPKRADGNRDLTARPSFLQGPELDRGKELFQALFQGEVANLFHASLGSLRAQQ